MTDKPQTPDLTITLARVWLGNIDLSRRMVQNGYAIATSKYHKDYESAELHARRNKRGLWSGGHESISDPAAHRPPPLESARGRPRQLPSRSGLKFATR